MIEIEVLNKNPHQNYRVIEQDGIMMQISLRFQKVSAALKTTVKFKRTDKMPYSLKLTSCYSLCPSNPCFNVLNPADVDTSIGRVAVFFCNKMELIVSN